MKRNLLLALALAAGTAAALSTSALVGCGTLRGADAARADWRNTASRLDDRIRSEMGRKGIPGLAIALVDGDAVVWAQAYGVEDGERGVPAGVRTVWRAGSVSKMFTDLAVMRRVERGELDLDAPVTDWLPDFRPTNPFTTSITLRQLMAHRAGLVREPPVGNYFDPSGPSLAATVASLNETTLVYAPGSRTKYSNAGIAVVGRLLEVVAGRPFAQIVREEVLEPMGLVRAGFEPTPAVRERLARAQMWTYWGTTFPAPTFELGMAPAGSLYADVEELARAIRVFLAGGEGPRGAVVQPGTLEEMWKPQFEASGAKSGFGLGFHVGDFAGTRRVGHDGAIYGFSTILSLLPDLGLGVVCVASKDVAHGTLEGIVDEALAGMARVRRGEPPAPRPPPPLEVGKERALRLAGRWRSADGKRTIELLEQQGELWLRDRARRARLRASGDRLVADDLVFSGTRIQVLKEGAELELDGTRLARAPAPRPPPPPEAWRGLIGEYGFDHNVLHVFEEEGELHALIEWFFDYTLARESDDVWAFPGHGLYFGERIVFERGADGVAARAIAAGVAFERRAVGSPAGETFRIAPERPVAELRAEALRAQPPRESGRRRPELVDLMALDPTLHFDVRYATDDNFLGTPVYEEARAFLQAPAADALLRAHRSLAREGYGLLVHDAYRPWFVTRIFWDATPADQHHMVADPAKGSRHNRGCAVDLTLYELATGAPVRMPSGYDEFSERANPWHPGGTSEERWLRDLLRRAMEAQGFSVYEHEWWHFDFGAWREYPVLNLRFGEIAVP